jgi:hypothetical protein
VVSTTDRERSATTILYTVLLDFSPHPALCRQRLPSFLLSPGSAPRPPVFDLPGNIEPLGEGYCGAPFILENRLREPGLAQTAVSR